MPLTAAQPAETPLPCWTTSAYTPYARPSTAGSIQEVVVCGATRRVPPRRGTYRVTACVGMRDSFLTVLSGHTRPGGAGKSISARCEVVTVRRTRGVIERPRGAITN